MAQAFLNRTPMTLTFEDFNGNEKISYLQQKFSIAGDIHAEETKGNFCQKPAFSAVIRYTAPMWTVPMQTCAAGSKKSGF